MSERSELDPRSSDDELLRGIGLLDPQPAPPVAPPADLWGRIAAAADEANSSEVVENDVADEPTEDDHAVVTGGRPTGVAPVVDLTNRRRKLPLLGAAAAAAVVGVFGMTAVLDGDDDAEPVAQVALDPLVDDAAVGAAELVLDGDRYTLRIDAEAQPADGEFLELWLIDEGVTEPRSLGRFTGAGDYDVPADIDPEAFPIVDISTEPDDGDAAHSGASVLRGALEL